MTGRKYCCRTETVIVGPVVPAPTVPLYRHTLVLLEPGAGDRGEKADYTIEREQIHGWAGCVPALYATEDGRRVKQCPRCGEEEEDRSLVTLEPLLVGEFGELVPDSESRWFSVSEILGFNEKDWEPSLKRLAEGIARLREKKRRDEEIEERRKGAGQ